MHHITTCCVKDGSPRHQHTDNGLCQDVGEAIDGLAHVVMLNESAFSVALSKLLSSWNMTSTKGGPSMLRYLLITFLCDHLAILRARSLDDFASAVC